MKWIGLTGGIATGKSTATKLLREMGYLVVDADEIAKQAVQPGSLGLRKVIEKFGQEFLRPDGSLDRKKLGERIFSNQNEKEALEKIIHPFVQEEVLLTRKAAEAIGTKIAFYDVPLLFEKKLEKQFDQILLIAADEKTQHSRLKSRDGFSVEQSSLRLQNQIPMQEKRKKANFVIENDSDIENLKKQLEVFLKSVIA